MCGSCAAGKLIGRFYTETGQPTDALLHVEAFLSEGLKKKAQAQSEMQLYPACNSEWSEASGGRVWCSTMRSFFDFLIYQCFDQHFMFPKNVTALIFCCCSGGIHRDWVGVPRMLFSPGSGHSRCVCIRLSNPVQAENRNLREYKDCPPHAESCRITKD